MRFSGIAALGRMKSKKGILSSIPWPIRSRRNTFPPSPCLKKTPRSSSCQEEISPARSCPDGGSCATPATPRHSRNSSGAQLTVTRASREPSAVLKNSRIAIAGFSSVCAQRKPMDLSHAQRNCADHPSHQADQLDQASTALH